MSDSRLIENRIKRAKKILGLGAALTIAASAGYEIGETVGRKESDKEKMLKIEKSTNGLAYEDYKLPLEDRVKSLEKAIKEGNLKIKKEKGNIKCIDKDGRIVAEIAAASKGKSKDFQNIKISGNNFSFSYIEFYIYEHAKVPIVHNGIYIEAETKEGVMREDIYHYSNMRLYLEMNLKKDGRTLSTTFDIKENEVKQFRENFEEEEGEFNKSLVLPGPYSNIPVNASLNTTFVDHIKKRRDYLKLRNDK